MTSDDATSPDDFVFTISRTVKAPRALVWQVHTEEKHLKQWFGPKGLTMPSCRLDLRPAGMFHYQLRAPDGFEFWGRWIFREIVAPERLVVIVSFADAAGNIVRNPWNENWPLQILSTTTFAEQDGKTTVTVRWSAYEAKPEERKAFSAGADSMRQGWTGTLDQLEAYLAKR